jgi:hypothetical protein
MTVTQEHYCIKIIIRLIFAMSVAIDPARKKVPMNFQDLHELLRQELQRRIENGALTGSLLARQAGFQQAHVSNFLNRKRALSLEGLDRVLNSQNLTIEQILPLELSSEALNASSFDSVALTSVAAKFPGDTVETVPVVSPSTAIHDARIPASAVIETLHVSATRLRDNRSRPSRKTQSLQRFLAIRADAHQSAAMDPLLQPGSLAVLDRHYTSLAPYRSHQPNLYAIRSGSSLLIRFAETDQNHLILRPHSPAYPIQLIPLTPNESPSDYIVGRICMVFSEY